MLEFDKKQAYKGTYTYEGITYDAYQVTYCTKPITGLVWDGKNSEDYFKMNIKIPEGCKQDTQILYYNPWGGDLGHTPSSLDTLDNAQKIAVMKAGWVLVEPGMRGNNCYTGKLGQEDYYDYGKIPWPLVDLKAGIRYLRYNKDVLPGNTDRIWISGVSSGGCASTIIASSGDDEIFTPYLEAIGAANTSDAVYGTSPSCPVMNRSNGDAALVWERWNNFDDANEYNRELAKYFPPYFNSLHLKAEIETEHIAIGDVLTDQNLKEYLYAYVKKSAIKFFSKMTKEEIQQYLLTDKVEDKMYGTPETSREWIQPVYENNKVVDIEGSYDEFWHYVCGDVMYDNKNVLNWQFDKPCSAPKEIFVHDNIIDIRAGQGLNGEWSCPSSYSFGKGEDYVAVFTKFGMDWIHNRGIEVSKEYQELVEFQRNCVNPMYFIYRGKSKIARHWFLRTGSVDQVTPHPLFIALGTKLMNEGYDVDIAFVWDQMHALTKEIPEFMKFAESISE